MMLNFYKFDWPRGGSKRGWTEWWTFCLLVDFKGKAVYPSRVGRKASCHKRPKDGEFGYFERMNRQKVSRVKAMLEIAAEIMVWEGPVDYKKSKSLLIRFEFRQMEDHAVKNRKHCMRDGPFSTANHRESFTKTTGVVKHCPYICPQGVSCLSSEVLKFHFYPTRSYR